MLHTDDAPVDPFAHRQPSGWWSQHEQQMLAKKDDDEDDDADLEDDDEDDDDEDDDEDADKDEATLRAELKRVRESLSKASGSGKKKRDRIKALEAELATARKPKPAADSKGDEPDVEAIRATVEAEAKVKADTKIKRAEARGALRSAGVPVAQVGDLVAMLKLDDLDVDDDGEVEGLDEAIDELKAKWPQLFAAPRKRRSVGGNDDRDDDGSKSKRTLSPSELQARVALGRATR